MSFARCASEIAIKWLILRRFQRCDYKDRVAKGGAEQRDKQQVRLVQLVTFWHANACWIGKFTSTRKKKFNLHDERNSKLA